MDGVSQVRTISLSISFHSADKITVRQIKLNHRANGFALLTYIFEQLRSHIQFNYERKTF